MNPLQHALESVSQSTMAPANILDKSVYDELKNVAHRLMNRERKNHTLSPTELVHEVYSIVADRDIKYKDSKHFFCIVARQMRRFLVDYGRHKSILKNAKRDDLVLYTDSLGLSDNTATDFALISEAIDALSAMHLRSMQVVELHYFAALSQQQTAETLGVSLATVEKDLKFARAFIGEYISNNIHN